MVDNQVQPMPVAHSDWNITPYLQLGKMRVNIKYASQVAKYQDVRQFFPQLCKDSTGTYGRLYPLFLLALFSELLLNQFHESSNQGSPGKPKFCLGSLRGPQRESSLFPHS